MGQRKCALLVLTLLFVVFAHRAQAQAVQSIQINQAIGVQKNGALKFVAGKDTVVRALMASAVTVDPAQSSATITRDGTLVATLAPSVASGPVSIVDFVCPNRAACGNWAAGSYVFDVRVNGQSASTAGTTYRFQVRDRLRVLALPLKTNYNGTIVSVANDSWKSLWEFTRNVYPIAADGLAWTIGPELDASTVNIESNDGQYALWDALAKLNPAHCAANRKADGCFDKIVGFIPARLNGYPNGTVQGYTFGNPANIVVASDEDAAATVAHEIAHNYAIGDAYDGGSFNCVANPTPDAFSGKDFTTQAPVKCTAGKVALPRVSATLIPAAHHPYEVGGRGALPDVGEYMGSGGPQAAFWTSQDAYDWLFDRLSPSGSSTSSFVSLTPTRYIRPTAIVGSTGSQRLLEFSGLLRRALASSADVRLDPWQSFIDDVDVVPDTTGTLMIAAVNAVGQRVATTALTVKFDLPGPKGQAPVQLSEAPFEGVIKFPTGTTKFQIINNGNVLREVLVSANVPVISNLSMGVGSVFTGPTAISWTATDADRDTLTYDVEYDPDISAPHNDFEEIYDNILNANAVVDFSKLPGGNRAKIRVTVSDGVNTAFVDSPEFRVPFKAPDVSIKTLSQAVFQQGADVVLHAIVEDLQDGELPEVSLVWTSDLSGRIGTGETYVTKTLAGGQHTITLTATNSAGLSTSKSITVTVVPTRRRLP